MGESGGYASLLSRTPKAGAPLKTLASRQLLLSGGSRRLWVDDSARKRAFHPSPSGDGKTLVNQWLALEMAVLNLEGQSRVQSGLVCVEAGLGQSNSE